MAIQMGLGKLELSDFGVELHFIASIVLLPRLPRSSWALVGYGKVEYIVPVSRLHTFFQNNSQTVWTDISAGIAATCSAINCCSASLKAAPFPPGLLLKVRRAVGRTVGLGDGAGLGGKAFRISS